MTIEIKEILQRIKDQEIALDNIVANFHNMGEREIERQIENVSHELMSINMAHWQGEGCPCGTKGQCCARPEVQNPAHECTGEKVCEKCFVLRCLNCGAECNCNI